jgi:hypothetical protein
MLCLQGVQKFGNVHWTWLNMFCYIYLRVIQGKSVLVVFWSWVVVSDIYYILYISYYYHCAIVIEYNILFLFRTWSACYSCHDPRLFALRLFGLQ